MPAALPAMERLKKRADFVALRASPSQAACGAVVQVRFRGDTRPARVGFTVTRKLGDAVRRNRIRRRLREAVRLAGSDLFRPGHDYVVIGRAATAARNFDDLINDLRYAVTHAASKDPSRSRNQPEQT